MLKNKIVSPIHIYPFKFHNQTYVKTRIAETLIDCESIMLVLKWKQQNSVQSTDQIQQPEWTENIQFEFVCYLWWITRSMINSTCSSSSRF